MEEYMPPTTRIPLQSNKKYHVFLSFRGKDVRKSLVDHLFEALSAAGLHVFLDSDKLEKGEIIGLSLERAIESSAIRIPIFSKGYADSAWCLREAAAMLRTPGLIIPLFYDVDPTHVRYPLKGSSQYKQAFLKHYDHSDRYPREEIDGWKHALQQICSCSGWSMNITGGFEAQLVKKVVNDVIKTLDRVPLEVAKHPVGMESITKDLIHKFKLNSVGSVVKAGLWGIGGIGKTTLAKALYNQVYLHFDAASFVFNVRATAGADSMGLTKLQKKILKDLTKSSEEVDSVEEGISLFRERLGRKRVLLILDDVDAKGQSNALVGDWLAPGSGVIITSRDKHILHVAGVSSECIHEVSGLQINEALQLFSWHAFLRASPSPTHEDLSRRMVKACKGHPLSLEVIGAFLYDKHNDRGCWTEALDNITRNPDIHKTLYISYSALSEEEKEIFLDIACFFIGEDKTNPIVFWKSLYKMVHTVIANLSMQLLIKIDDKGVFDMHDHLRDMGRTIAEKEKEGSRIWEAAHLSTVSNDINFSRFQLNGGNSQRLETLCRPGLRFLSLQNLLFEGITEDTLAMLPPSLIWLRLENCHFTFATRKPLRCRLVGNIWQLRIMQVNDVSLRDLSRPQQLELDGCESLNNHRHTIGNLPRLQHLDLCFCTSLNRLLNTISNLPRLQHLDLRYCISLNCLHDAIGNFSQLQHLNLTLCIRLKNLHNTIGNLSQLQHLNLSHCSELKNLPRTIGNLSHLEHLNLGGCLKLKNLPNTIGNLSQVQHLNLSFCVKLNNLPNTIGNFSRLQHFDLGGCIKLKELPGTIGNLLQLQHLDLAFCESLYSLPNTIGNLSQLHHLNLNGCKRLKNLPDTIGNISQLQKLNLEGCRKLKNLPYTIGNLSQLQHLNLGFCIRLYYLPHSTGNLSQLQHLNLGFCIRLNYLPHSIGNLSQLQHLDLQHCINLNNLPNTIGNLSQLQHLILSYCIKLNDFSDAFGNLLRLQQLDLKECILSLIISRWLIIWWCKVYKHESCRFNSERLECIS